MEDQAFLQSYGSAPRPPFFLCVAGQAKIREKGKGVGEEPNRTTARKPDPL